MAFLDPKTGEIATVSEEDRTALDQGDEEDAPTVTPRSGGLPSIGWKCTRSRSRENRAGPVTPIGSRLRVNPVQRILGIELACQERCPQDERSRRGLDAAGRGPASAQPVLRAWFFRMPVGRRASARWR